MVEPSQMKNLLQLHLMRQIGYHVVQTYIPRYKTIIAKVEQWTCYWHL